MWGPKRAVNISYGGASTPYIFSKFRARAVIGFALSFGLEFRRCVFVRALGVPDIHVHFLDQDSSRIEVLVCTIERTCDNGIPEVNGACKLKT